MSTMGIIQRPSVKLINPSYHFAKRAFDLLIALLMLPILVPVFVTIGILIVLDSPGPVFFRQTRVGKDGREFQIYKFRTMVHKFDDSAHREYMKQFIQGGAEASENGDFKPPITKQITRVGAFLRKTSLDELPQMINIVQGNMSLVGPRPNVVWEVEEYDPWHTERLEVKPGITGLAQVHGRSSISFDEIVSYDVEYVRNQSLWLDFKIIIGTFLAVMKREGAR